MRKWLPIVLLCAWPLAAQKYTGPRPAKPDLPYLMHADNLIPTESLEAKPDERKGEVNYVIPGAANSTVRTPLASPAFLVLTDQLQADHLQLFKLQSKGDHREILVSRKNKAVARPHPAQRHRRWMTTSTKSKWMRFWKTARIFALAVRLEPGFLLPGLLSSRGRQICAKDAQRQASTAPRPMSPATSTPLVP